MNRTYVALDLETTGLDAERDTILEVGAVCFRVSFKDGGVQARVLKEWRSLVNPGRPIPIQVQQLTGILQDQVDGAPRFSQISNVVQRFVEAYPVVGHSIGFDLAFLRSHGLDITNSTVDTFELASVLVPHTARYSLELLGQAFDLPSLQSHRALADAQSTKDLFVALLQHAYELPRPILREISRLAADVDWPLKEIFRDVEQAQASGAFLGAIGQQLAARVTADEDALGPLFATRDEEGLELKPAATPRALDVESLAAMLGPDGLFAQRFPHFEHRPEQVEMLRAVANAFNNGQHLMVEAGTGTGKSLAYLLPAIMWAHLNGERVVISTNTINLQDQLYHKDAPDLAQILPFEFRVAVLKGRSNYLCQRRLAVLRQAGVSSADEMRMLAKVLVWLPSTQTGERGELFMPSAAEQSLWDKVAADSETCTAERCRFRERERCFFYRARKAAERAHLVIVNHALLLSDVAVANRVLPEYRYLIVDEAHHLEASVTGQLSFQADRWAVERMLNELAQSSGAYGAGRRVRSAGFLSDVLARCRGVIPPEDWTILEGHVQTLQRRTETAKNGLYTFFDLLGGFLRGQGKRGGEYDQRVRLTSGLRVQPGWSDIEIAWDNVAAQLRPVVEGLEALCAGLTELEGYQVRDLEGTIQDCAGYLSRLRAITEQIDGAIVDPDGKSVYWATLSSRDDKVSLHAAPLHVGSLVEKHLFHTKESVILTSATLSTDGRFDYMRERLQANEADELTVGSPFDYEQSTLLYIPVDIPEPNEPYYQKTLCDTLLRLCRATDGRTLVLFTSYSQLRTTAHTIERPLADDGIIVYQQGAGTGRAQLLENFRSTPRSVLLGTRSFWEGIDVIGEALSVLVITRLPFQVPDDPIFSARSETFDDPFAEYAVPETILRFRQGFGRLIRTKTDRGVVVVLDKRVLTKSYGAMFLNSLPNCTRVRASVAKLPEAARRWLANEWPSHK